MKGYMLHRDPPISSYRARSPLATSRYPDPIIGPPPLRPSSPRTGIYRYALFYTKLK